MCPSLVCPGLASPGSSRYQYLCHNIPRPDYFLLSLVVVNLSWFMIRPYRWLSPHVGHVCTVYVSTPHVKTSQISMKWSLERRQGQTSPPAHFDVRSLGRCQLSANQRRVWRHEDQSEGRKTGQWREVRGEEAGKCRCLCGESIMFTDEEIWHNLDIFGIHHNATLLRCYPRLMPISSPRLACSLIF